MPNQNDVDTTLANQNYIFEEELQRVLEEFRQELKRIKDGLA